MRKTVLPAEELIEKRFSGQPPENFKRNRNLDAGSAPAAAAWSCTAGGVRGITRSADKIPAPVLVANVRLAP